MYQFQFQSLCEILGCVALDALQINREYKDDRLKLI